MAPKMTLISPISYAFTALTIFILLATPAKSALGDSPFSDRPIELKDAEGATWDHFEPSGAVRYKDRLVMVDDDVNDIFLYSPEGKFIEKLSSPELPKKKAKFEDLAYDPGEDRFYIMTPHALAEGSKGSDDVTGKTLHRRSLIYSFQMDTDTPAWSIRPGSVRSYDLTPALLAAGLPYGTEKMALEGLEIDPNGGFVTIGFRRPEPMLYRFPLADLRSGKPPGSFGQLAKLHFSQPAEGAPPYKISGLHYDSARHGSWVLASTEVGKHRYFGSELWFWADAANSQPILVFTAFDSKDKAEGICTEPDGSLVLVYDNDQGSVAAEGQNPLDFVARMRLIPSTEINRRLPSSP